ncbi:hypothetical protein GCM10009617_25210 [Leifsonia poae]|uniref:Uncharacterized protein n=1 Tax=Leifsonia poae TaxID=110933 RepID=A0A9W6HC16_9MICO|nr:hypothetical protein GCM10017584_28630 [Leifsonia poae]
MLRHRLGDGVTGTGSGDIAAVGRTCSRDGLHEFALSKFVGALKTQLGGESLKLGHFEGRQITGVHAPGVEIDISH